MSRTILFVDDEKQILRAMKRLFYKSEYDVVIAEGGLAALEIMSTTHIDMVISDMRMPEMDGYELLSIIKEKYPEVIRIALSGYTDKSVVMKALNDNVVKLYLFKPWNNDEIIQSMKGLFILEERLKDQNLMDLINNLTEIPTIPDVYIRVSKMVEEERSIKEIADYIEQDQALTSKILRIANSAYYGSKTGDIQSAIMFIGMVNVKNIILTSEVFQSSNVNKERMEVEWKHSGLTNKILNLIYKKFVDGSLPIEQKSAGLLSNIGKPVMLINQPEVYNGYMSSDNCYESVERELEIQGVSHQQLGGYLMNWWELPLPIVECAFFHHNPMNKGIINRKLVMSVHLAQHYAWVELGQEDKEGLDLSVLNELSIDKEVLEEYLKKQL